MFTLPSSWYDRNTVGKDVNRQTINPNRFYTRQTLTLGSTSVHKYTIIWSAWRTSNSSMHQCKFQHCGETRKVLHNKTNTETLEETKLISFVFYSISWIDCDLWVWLFSQDLSHVMRKPVLWHMRTTKTQTSLRIRAVCSTTLLFAI